MTLARIVDLGSDPCRLRVRNDCLEVSRTEQKKLVIPFIEIACLIIPPYIELTSAVVSALTIAGGAVLFVDARWQPASMALPFAGHSAQTQRMGWQIDRVAHVRDDLWAQIVRAKILSQSRTLGSHPALEELAENVVSGDLNNVEAQAARIYWPALMGESFRRDREAEDETRVLNYGYAVLRAAVARAASATGLCLSVGLHHKSKYDAFVLASDLMEPYRVIVDRAVQKRLPVKSVTLEIKRDMLSELLGTFSVMGSAMSLFEMVAKMSTSLVEHFHTGAPLWIGQV